MKFKLLNPENEIPSLGFGTWQLSGKNCIEAVTIALSTGYRHIDTASMYRNQKEIGKAVKQSDVDRAEIFITSKVWRSELGRENTKMSFEDTLEELQTDYLDLYLIHWPGSNRSDRLDSYEVMMELRDEGKIKNIGVSNFTPPQMLEIHDKFGEYPSVNQIHFNPFHYNGSNLKYCNSNNIVLTAYTPLNKGNGLNHPNIRSLADKYSKTNAQIVLRWFLEQGVVTIPKAGSANHINENFDIFDFSLSDDEVESLKNL